MQTQASTGRHRCMTAQIAVPKHAAPVSLAVFAAALATRRQTNIEHRFEPVPADGRQEKSGAPDPACGSRWTFPAETKMASLAAGMTYCAETVVHRTYI